MSRYLLKNINPSYRAAITKIRLSAHKFPIETERYIGIPRGDRVCPLGCQTIGDEYHYLLACSHPSIDKAFTPIFRELKGIHPELDNMGVLERGEFLLTNDNISTLNLTGKLCYIIQAIFKEITW